MTCELLHIGHLRIIRKCAKIGTLFIGLLTEKALEGYKECITPYKYRKELLEALPEVFRVIPQNSLNMYDNLVAYDITQVVSGDGWEPEELKSIKKAGCKKVDLKLNGEKKGQKTYSVTNIKQKICQKHF